MPTELTYFDLDDGRERTLVVADEWEVERDGVLYHFKNRYPVRGGLRVFLNFMPSARFDPNRHEIIAETADGELFEHRCLGTEEFRQLLKGDPNDVEVAVYDGDPYAREAESDDD